LEFDLRETEDVAGTLRITQIRSVIGRIQNQRRVMRALGITRLNQTVEHKDTPGIRGMIEKVNHLVKVEEV
jgi:large subunit ribosomal protein L30